MPDGSERHGRVKKFFDFKKSSNGFLQLYVVTCCFVDALSPPDRIINSAEKEFDSQNYPSYIAGVKKQYLFGLFAVSILLVSCVSWVMEKPSLVLREITVRPRSFTEIDFLLGLDVQNPNRFDLTLKSFEYTVYLNTEEIGNGRLEREVTVPASSMTRLQVPVSAKFKDWSTSLKTILAQEGLPYKIEGKADIKTVFGSLHYPFSSEGRINLKN
ncbi:hypothetical protein EG832_00815 [bacterium]|nr:hypothetical protein [bacterium]